MLKVAVTDYTFANLDIEKSILEPLDCEVIGRQCKTEEELIDLTKDADYIITQFAKVNASVIKAMEKCNVIVRYGIGVDNVDLEAAAKKGIPVCNIPDYCIDEVADHTLAMMLSLIRQVCYISGEVKNGKWKIPVSLAQMRTLKEMTVGIIGFGRIGREVASRLKGFKCKLRVFDPGVDAATIEKAGCTPATLDEIYKASDLITLHCPSNVKTRYMVNEDSIKRMKKGALLVNASRGDLIKTDDLIAALKNGYIGGVALDVTDPEPINTDSPLLTMENVIITNHIASASVNAVKRLRESAAHPVVCAIHGEKLPNVVNGIIK